MTESLCGVWVDAEGRVHLSVARADGAREERVATLRPFAWLTPEFDLPPAQPDGTPTLGGLSEEPLQGGGFFTRLLHAESLAAFDAFLKFARESGGADAVRSLESQFLLQQRRRLFDGLAFAQLRRCQLDIETGSTHGGFSNAGNPEDRVLAIGLRCGAREHLLVLAEMTDAAEKALLESFNAALAAEDPDIIEGHNIFKFDLDYLRQRAKRLKVPCAWGRFGQKATFRTSRLKVAERWIDFPRCDLPGRTVVDTYLLVQLYDITTRELVSYGLKEIAVYFGITDGTARASGQRTYLAGNRIQDAYQNDRARFLAYLSDDLRETRGVADLLLPTYVEQVRTFPILLQEGTLRGTTGKIDLLFLEEYYHARQACPVPPEVKPFEGGYTRSFQEGVFRHVLHFDVASLYPSLLLAIGRNPATDTLGVFIPLLTKLRQYRLHYKQLARTGETDEIRAEAQARQANFKILINSFYGYLGFSGARFGDGDLAAEVTRRGRELLQTLIDEFARQGCTILEADTDGIYLSSEAFFDQPEALLAKVVGVLPPGIELEYDGRYAAMFCYKAKNYALYDGKKLTIRGSALRSRGIEPFLRKMGDQLIKFLVGADPQSPLVLYEDYRARLSSRSLPVSEVARSETLSQNSEAYERFAEGGGKPRRASAEAALLLDPRPRMGDRVVYYVAVPTPGKTNEWQRARPISLFDPGTAPYDASYYLKKLEDWLERYRVFLGLRPAVTQVEMDFG